MSAVTSISLNGVFTAGYENYAIVIRWALGTGADNVSYRMRLSGTDDTSSNYGYQELVANGATASASRSTGLSSGRICTAHPHPTGWLVQVYGPALAEWTVLRSVSTRQNGTASDPVIYDIATNHVVTTAYDGITFFPASSSLTGTVRVYGYEGA